jgi:hypothetical protein
LFGLQADCIHCVHAELEELAEARFHHLRLFIGCDFLFFNLGKMKNKFEGGKNYGRESVSKTRLSTGTENLAGIAQQLKVFKI